MSVADFSNCLFHFILFVFISIFIFYLFIYFGGHINTKNILPIFVLKVLLRGGGLSIIHVFSVFFLFF